MSRVSEAPVTAAPPTAIPADRSPGRLRVEVKRDLHLDAADALALHALLEQRPSAGVFLSKAWLSGLFAEPPDGVEPSLVLLRDGAALRGIAALGARLTRAHAHVTLLGGGAGSDRIDLIATRGFEAACADRLLAWLADTFGTGFVLALRDVPADSPLWGAVHRANAERSPSLTLQPREIHMLPYLDLRGHGSFAIGAMPSAWHPASLAKHRRALERRCHLQIDLLDDEREVMEAFDTLVTLLHARWHQQGGSALDEERACRFHRHVLPLLLREGRLRMIRLSAGARTIGVFYGVAAGDWWGYYLAGYDREWAGRVHLGQILLAAAIDMAAQHGASEFDFLKGADRVKYLWPVHERATLDADIYAAGRSAQWRRATHATREAAVALAKSAYGGIRIEQVAARR